MDGTLAATLALAAAGCAGACRPQRWRFLPITSGTVHGQPARYRYGLPRHASRPAPQGMAGVLACRCGVDLARVRSEPDLRAGMPSRPHLLSERFGPRRPCLVVNPGGARLRLGLHGCNRPAKTISPRCAFLAATNSFRLPALHCVSTASGATSRPRRPDHNKDAMGANLVQPKGEIIMANIGTFTADKDGFTGTLRRRVKVKLVPNDKGSENALPPPGRRPRHRRGVEQDQRGRAGIMTPRRSFVPGSGLCPRLIRERGRYAPLIWSRSKPRRRDRRSARHRGGALCCSPTPRTRAASPRAPQHRLQLPAHLRQPRRPCAGCRP